MKKISKVWVVIFILATVLCIFGQELAYFLSEYFIPIFPVYYLSGSTIIGILLYIVSGFLLFRLFKKQDSVSHYRDLFLLVFFIVAPGASIWSIFVTVMWWG
ncbi:hypothetical protein P6709_06160 [Jeotgalibacillus sp. ET6]|uniref:hypothetical protein n=1 Tax=Jeotgalibacillus sp. ET6 TaxID=3037260 RepID=UPI0024181E8F|nr:hypothetical protein [Jeotgalibacillus sp. ET6]MDG5471324.1 hypothetical protein [Jeotgalibacillus sp. ET6]